MLHRIFHSLALASNILLLGCFVFLGEASYRWATCLTALGRIRAGIVAGLHELR
jgi:hypothetical protein